MGLGPVICAIEVGLLLSLAKISHMESINRVDALLTWVSFLFLVIRLMFDLFLLLEFVAHFLNFC